MRDEALERAILRILSRLPGVSLRQDTLAMESEIALDRTLSRAAFADSLQRLVALGLVELSTSLLGDVAATLTAKGREALRP